MSSARLCHVCLWVCLCGLSPATCPGQVRSDERVIFFDTDAWLDPEGRHWIVPVHGWIFEPEEDDYLRRQLIESIQDSARLDPDGDEAGILRSRLAGFLVDNERGKRITIQVGDERHTFGPSAIDGHFTGQFKITAAQAARLAPEGTLTFHVPLGDKDGRSFAGRAHLIQPAGLSVISDIDDTVKVTEVRDPVALTRNTFVRPFRAADGMAELYRRWAGDHVTFHYVSSSPWQLYPPLQEFFDVHRFPRATLYLKRARLKDKSVLQLIQSPLQGKPPAIEALLHRYPQRRFILVGDSGEMDPEVYAQIYREHPGRIEAIYIRNVTREDARAPRYQSTFKDVPADRWTIFSDPATLDLPGRAAASPEP